MFNFLPFKTAPYDSHGDPHCFFIALPIVLVMLSREIIIPLFKSIIVFSGTNNILWNISHVRHG